MLSYAIQIIIGTILLTLLVIREEFQGLMRVFVMVAGIGAIGVLATLAGGANKKFLFAVLIPRYGEERAKNILASFFALFLIGGAGIILLNILGCIESALGCLAG